MQVCGVRSGRAILLTTAAGIAIGIELHLARQIWLWPSPSTIQSQRFRLCSGTLEAGPCCAAPSMIRLSMWTWWFCRRARRIDVALKRERTDKPLNPEFENTGQFNAYGIAAISVPCGFSSADPPVLDAGE